MAEIDDAQLTTYQQQQERLTALEAEATAREQQAAADKAEREREKAALAEAQRQNQAYQQYLQQLAAQQQQAQRPPPAAEEMPDPVVQPGEYRKWHEQRTLESVAPIVHAASQTMMAGMQREQANLRRQSATDAANKPFFEKYGAEIDAMVNALPLDQRVQVDPQTGRSTYDNAILAVKAQHFEELQQEAVERELTTREQAARQARIEAGEEEEEEPEGEEPPVHRAVPPPIPSARGAATPARTMQRRKAPVKLDAGQQHYADVFGISADEYATWDDPDMIADAFGLRDPKTGKLRPS